MIKPTSLLLFAAISVSSLVANAQTDLMDDANHPVMYLRGDFSNHDWDCHDDYNGVCYRFNRDGDNYSISLPALNGQFKIGSTRWSYNFGGKSDGITIDSSRIVSTVTNGYNFIADNVKNLTISFSFALNDSLPDINATRVTFIVDGKEPVTTVDGISGTLPVLYINVKNDDGSFNDEIIDKDLAHKNYFSGEYWLDINGCQWMADEGAASIASAGEPLPLEIKARGNYTRTAFAKKPFKIKLGKKQNMLGITPEKSKHYALLAHADDNWGYLRNFTGFNLGKRIKLPWTPSQQPVELVINGDYRGLYFLTESIRVGDGRVDIASLDDNASDPNLISGGYLVELDNYDEENQISMDEKGTATYPKDRLRITFDTPETYSDVQLRFVSDQFTAINDLIGLNSDSIWSYIDLDDAVRYYIVEELLGHTEAYHGSTYLFRDRGDGQKWHFSPIWDCGNAFNGSTSNHFYHNSPFGNTWIPSLRLNNRFNEKAAQTWLWFMANKFEGLTDEMFIYTYRIDEAAKADRRRWKGQPRPDSSDATDVADNSDINTKCINAVAFIHAKAAWLKQIFGHYEDLTNVPEPQRDDTPAAPLPTYATGVETISADTPADTPATYYNLQGIPVDNPIRRNIYIRRQGAKAVKVRL